MVASAARPLISTIVTNKSLTDIHIKYEGFIIVACIGQECICILIVLCADVVRVDTPLPWRCSGYEPPTSHGIRTTHNTLMSDYVFKLHVPLHFWCTHTHNMDNTAKDTVFV